VQESPSLLGRGRAKDIIVNQVLPFVFAGAAMGSDLTLASQTVYTYLGCGALPDNEHLRYMKSLLGLVNVRGLRACAQQGMLHIYHTYCRTRECPACPVFTCRRPDPG